MQADFTSSAQNPSTIKPIESKTNQKVNKLFSKSVNRSTSDPGESIKKTRSSKKTLLKKQPYSDSEEHRRKIYKAIDNASNLSMHEAASNEDLESIKRIYERTRDIDPPDEYGETPLSYLIAHKVTNYEEVDQHTIKVIRYFVKNGAKISATIREKAENHYDGELTYCLEIASEKSFSKRY